MATRRVNITRKRLSPSRRDVAVKTATPLQMAGLYDLGETLGKGHYAVVKSARHVFTGERVAVKVIDKSKLDDNCKKSLLKEVLCMKLVQHPNVVKLYEVIDTDKKLFLVLELGNGDLYDIITKNNNAKGGGLDEDLARYYFGQIVSGVSYCHKLHVVHRDLKPENVVFFQNNNSLKLTDFGFSNKFCPGVKLETSCGSLAYSAPEILLGDAYDPPAVDVWSLGVMLYMLIVGRPPFQEANDSETLTMIMDVKYTIPQTVSKSCRDLIQLMLQKLPENRPRIYNIQRHPWMENLCLSDDISLNELTTQDKNGIIQEMINGKVVRDKELVLQSLESDAYNYITSTFYLLAEKLLRERESLIGGEVEEEEELMTTASLESIGPPSSSTRIRRRSSLLCRDEFVSEESSNNDFRRITSLSCSSGLADLNKLVLYKEEDELQISQETEESETSSESPVPEKKLGSKLLTWLKSLGKFNNNNNNNNNKIYKTKSCSELKSKFVK